MPSKNEIITFSENNIAQIEKLEEFLETMDYPLVSSEEFTSAYSKLVEHKKEAEALQKAIDSKLKEEGIFKKPHEKTDETKVPIAVVERLVKQEPIYYQDEDREIYYMEKYCVNLVNNTISFTLPDDDELEYFLSGHQEEVKLPLDQYKKSFWFKEDKSE